MSDDEVANLAAWLERARKRWGLGEEQLADVAGISRSTWRRYRNRQVQQVRQDSREDIVEALGLEHQDLIRILRGEDVPIPDTPPDAAERLPVPEPPNGEWDRLWQEFMDLRRTVIEFDARRGVEIQELRDQLRRLVDRLSEDPDGE